MNKTKGGQPNSVEGWQDGSQDNVEVASASLLMVCICMFNVFQFLFVYTFFIYLLIIYSLSIIRTSTTFQPRRLLNP
jgi:hypothetical protein